MASESFEKIDLSSIAGSSAFSETPLSSEAENFGFSETPMSKPLTGRRPSNYRDEYNGKTEPLTPERPFKPAKPQRDKNIADPGPEVTVIDLPAAVKIDPAVGWLVCIEGVDKGRSFRLVKGNNPIGRPGNGKNYAVSLTDQSISRKGACGVIVYNEKSNQFFITPGDLTTNINPYLNDEILLSPKLLVSRAVLEVAGDVLVFVPFCSDKFKWNFSVSQPQQHSQEQFTGAVNNREVIVKCEKGHYFDSATNIKCPFCAAMDAENDPDGETKIY